MRVDFGRTSEDYSNFRAGFPSEFFLRLAERISLRKGVFALDLGTGTGTVARGLSSLGADVTGCDRSDEMLERAKALDEGRNRFVCAVAESLPFRDEIFDIVTCGQCWHWFDRARAALECRRVLRTRGHLVIAHFDWLPLSGNVVDATEALILEYNPAWTMAGGTGIYPRWFADLSEVGFAGLESWTFDLPVSYTHEAWRGRIRASAGVAASLPEREVKKFDQSLAKMLARHFPGDPLDVPHRVFTLLGRKPD